MKLHIGVFTFCLLFFSYLLVVPKIYKATIIYASEPTLIDIIPGPNDNLISMDDIVDLNGIAIFEANNSGELWKSNGTSSGTKMIKDFYSYSGILSNLIKVDDNIFFNLLYLPDGSSYYTNSLWKTDGTENGTILIKDGIEMDSGTNVNGTLFFLADDGIHGKELWKSDGTQTGTVIVKDITPGSTGTTFVDKGMAVGEYFVITIGNKLWVSDGTGNGTKEIMPGLSADLVYKDVIFDGYLYFYGGTTEYGYEPWKTDGTTENTKILKDIVPGKDSSNPGPFVVFNNNLYFWTWDGQFYKSNGTSEGTEKVHEQTYYPEWPEKMVEMGNDLYFIGSDWEGEYGVELWKIEGDNGNASMVKDIYPGADQSGIDYLTVFGDKLYFSATDDSEGGYNTEPWVSDGTEQGTQMLANIEPQFDEGSYPRNFTKVGDNLFFIAQTYEHGEELYVLNSTKTFSNDSKLLSISVSGFSISPTFTSANTSYTLTVPESTTSISLVATTLHPLATILVNDISVTSGNSLALDVKSGVNTINIQVTAEDDITKTLYTLFVTRTANIPTQNNQNTDNDKQENDKNTQTTVLDEPQNKSNIQIVGDTNDLEKNTISKNEIPLQFPQNPGGDVTEKKRYWLPVISLILLTSILVFIFRKIRSNKKLLKIK